MAGSGREDGWTVASVLLWQIRCNGIEEHWLYIVLWVFKSIYLLHFIHNQQNSWQCVRFSSFSNMLWGFWKITNNFVYYCTSQKRNFLSNEFNKFSTNSSLQPNDYHTTQTLKKMLFSKYSSKRPFPRNQSIRFLLYPERWSPKYFQPTFYL